jgi:C-terminal processing protease CtpA/Prc
MQEYAYLQGAALSCRPTHEVEFALTRGTGGLGLTLDVSNRNGVEIVAVTDSARACGARAGDVLIKVDGKSVAKDSPSVSTAP